MKTKNYQIPLCEEILLAGEGVIVRPFFFFRRICRPDLKIGAL